MIGIIMLQQSIKTSFKVVIVLRYRNVRTNFINEKPKIRRKKGILISNMYQVFLRSSFYYYQDKLYTQVLLHIFTLSLCVIFSEFIGFHRFYVQSQSHVQYFLQIHIKHSKTAIKAESNKPKRHLLNQIEMCTEVGLASIRLYSSR